MITTSPVTIVGGGPSGALLAILLRQRGLDVTLYESRPDPRGRPGESGRSINLALAARGIHALQSAGVYQRLSPLMLPMKDRYIHHLDGAFSRQPYGQHPDDVNFSISRHELNQLLLDIAATEYGVRLQFEHRLENLDFTTGRAVLRNLRSGTVTETAMRPLIATDGAGSLARHRMAAQGVIEAHESELEHGYKELSIPANAAGDFAMPPDALHIWPRGRHMLIALPNADRSFTATLFLPKHGPSSFESLDAAPCVAAFFDTQFPDTRSLMPQAVTEFLTNPLGFLGTVHAQPWHCGAAVTLLGDAAHAIVPFHGQGMNCCFEDCVEFVACLDRHTDWQSVFEEFGRSRKPDTDAIATMALENYAEMRERVVDPKFKLQQALALELERRFPTRFIPRYAMVQFRHDIGYRTALERGQIQSGLLDALTRDVEQLAHVDFDWAGREIARQLAPIDALQSRLNVTKL